MVLPRCRCCNRYLYTLDRVGRDAPDVTAQMAPGIEVPVVPVVAPAAAARPRVPSARPGGGCVPPALAPRSSCQARVTRSHTIGVFRRSCRKAMSRFNVAGDASSCRKATSLGTLRRPSSSALSLTRRSACPTAPPFGALVLRWGQDCRQRVGPVKPAALQARHGRAAALPFCACSCIRPYTFGR